MNANNFIGPVNQPFVNRFGSMGAYDTGASLNQPQSFMPSMYQNSYQPQMSQPSYFSNWSMRPSMMTMPSSRYSRYMIMFILLLIIGVGIAVTIVYVLKKKSTTTTKSTFIANPKPNLSFMNVVHKS